MKSLLKIGMKKLLFFFLLVIAVVSCNTDDGSNSEEFLLPVEDATVPEVFASGQTGTITVKYRKPTDCHLFNGFFVDQQGSTLTISVRSLKFDQNNCQDDSATLYEAPFNFEPSVAGTYHFRFWTGNDSSGAPTFLEFESVVE